MAKQKKISFREFLNKRMKPIDGERYPVYVRVVYDSQNSRMRPTMHTDIFWTKEQLDDFKKGFFKDEQMQREAKTLKESEDIIEFVVRSIDEQVEDFKFSGVTEKVRFYQQLFLALLEDLTLEAIFNELEDLVLAKVYNKLKNEYEDIPTLIQNIEAIPISLEQEFDSKTLTLINGFLAYQQFYFQYRGPYIFSGSLYGWQAYGEKQAFLNYLSSSNPKKIYLSEKNNNSLQKTDYEEIIRVIDQFITRRVDVLN